MLNRKSLKSMLLSSGFGIGEVRRFFARQRLRSQRAAVAAPAELQALESRLYLSTIGGVVWEDLNGNNLLDAGEPGLAGVAITLLDGTGAVANATTTDSLGAYAFDVTSGTFSVQFAAPSNYQFAQPGLGIDPAVNSSADPNSGTTAAFAIGTGQTSLNENAGMFQLAGVGDFVWQDLNANGIQDAGEPGVPGIAVNLLDGTGAVANSTTTDDLGSYFFDTAPGTYTVQFVTPVGYQLVPAGQGTSPSLSSTPNPATGLSGPLALTSGQVNLDVDAGMVTPAVTVNVLKTNINTPTLTGTIADPASGGGITAFTVVVGGQTLTPTVTGTTWSVAVPVALGDGTYDVVATATDLLGNSAGDLTVNELVVDSVLPIVTVTPMFSTTGTPTLNGTVTDAAPSSGIASLVVVVGGQTLTATVTGTIWTVPVPVALADGTYSVQATATDGAGNTRTDPSSIELTVDTVAPVVTVDPLSTHSHLPMLTGTVSDAAPSSGALGVMVVVGGQTLAAAVSGTAWFVPVPVALTDGTYNIQATASDAAGNLGADATTDELFVGNRPPVLTLADLTISHNTPTSTIVQPTTDIDGDLVTYTATVANPNLTACNLVNPLGLLRYDPASTNCLGRNEKWVWSATSGYFIQPNGQFYQYVGNPLNPAAVLIGTLDVGFYADPSLLIGLTPANGLPFGTATVAGNQITIAHGPTFVGSLLVNVTASDGFVTVNGSYSVNVTNQAPVLTLTDVYLSHAVPTTITLPATDADGDTVIYTATVPNPNLAAYNLVHTLGLQRYDPASDNGLGRGEKWIWSTTNGWYYIQPNGAFYRYVGGTMVGTLDTRFYADPTLLIGLTPSAAGAAATVLGNQITLTPATGFVGSCTVNVSAGDGLATTTGSLALTVDTAPPAVTVTSLVTHSHFPTITGTVSDPAPSSGLAGMVVVVGGQTLSATVVGTAWSVTVPVSIPDGTYDVVATATDLVGNAGADATTNELFVGNHPPVVNPADQAISHTTSSSTITLPATDADGDPVTYTATVADPNLAAYNLVNPLGLLTYDPASNNCLGRNEKWVWSATGAYYIQPNGQFYQYVGNPLFPAGTLLGTLDTGFYAAPNLLIGVTPGSGVPFGTATVTGNQITVTHDPAMSVGSLLVNVTANDGLVTVSGSYRVNVTNQAPVLTLTPQTMSHLTPDFTITLPATDADGDTVTYASTLVSPSMAAFSLVNALGLQRYNPASDNSLGRGEKWIWSATNGWFYIQPDGTFYSYGTGALLGTLDTSYFADPTLLIGLTPSAAGVTATVLDNQITLTPEAGFIGLCTVNVLASDGITTTIGSFILTVT